MNLHTAWLEIRQGILWTRPEPALHIHSLSGRQVSSAVKGVCSPLAVRWLVTGSPGLRPSLVSDCKACTGSNRVKSPGVSAWARTGPLADGPCHRGDSVPGSGWVSRGGRRSCGGSLGWWGEAGGGDRSWRRRQTTGRLTGACHRRPAEPCVCADGTAAPRRWRSACHTDPPRTPSCRRAAGAHWGA